MLRRQNCTWLFILAGLLTAVAGCSVGAPQYQPRLAPHAIEVAVQPFTLRTRSDYKGPTRFETVFAEYLAGALQESGVAAVVLPASTAPPSTARYVIDGEITRVDPGSWNLRFWIGFGAGKATLAARVRVTDVATQNVVYSDVQEIHSVTLLGEENILRRSAASLAYIFARQIRPRVV